MNLVPLLVLLILLRLLRSCMLVRLVAADHATCGGPDEAVMPSEVTGGTADESALDASLGIGRCDPSRKRKRSRSADDGSPPDPNREVNTGAAGLFRCPAPRARLRASSRASSAFTRVFARYGAARPKSFDWELNKSRAAPHPGHARSRAMIRRWPASRREAAALLLQILRGCRSPALTPQQH
jgi:hypothetical protein